MSFLDSVLLVAGATLVLFCFVEYYRNRDIITVFSRVLKPKYLIPWVAVVAAFVVLRLILIALGPILQFIFSP